MVEKLSVISQINQHILINKTEEQPIKYCASVFSYQLIVQITIYIDFQQYLIKYLFTVRYD